MAKVWTDIFNSLENDQFSGLVDKALPVSADLLVLEDSAASGAKRKVQIGNLPTGGGGGIPEPADDAYGYLRRGDTSNDWVRGSRVFEQATAPSAPSVGDVWIDTS